MNGNYFFSVVIIVFISINIGNGSDYNLTPPGTNTAIKGDFGDYTPTYIQGGDGIYRIETHTARYNIYPAGGNIFCYQRVGMTRQNLTVTFTSTNVLSGISFNAAKSSGGYLIFENTNIKLAIHSDGTLWTHVIKPGVEIQFWSRVPRNYDKGGGKYNESISDYPVASRRVIDTNWMVITDSGSINDIESTGGFGVYTRPSICHKFLDSMFKGSEDGHYSKMVRQTGDDKVKLISSWYEGSYWTTRESKFIVSIFPTKHTHKLNEQNSKKIKFIHPGFFPTGNRTRSGFYGFPSEDEVRAWTKDTGGLYYNDNRNTNGLHYYCPIDSSPIPVTTLVLFELVWETASEVNATPPNGYATDYDPHAYIPYKTPNNSIVYNSQSILNTFLSNMCKPDFSHLDILIYVSPMDQYSQIPGSVLRYKSMSEQAFYDAFMNQIRTLFFTYPRINGLYIDTNPLNSNWDSGGISNIYKWNSDIEPMILSYRILRDLKLEYPDKIIMLHSSENPIGPMRLWGGINNLTTSAHRWHEPGLIQSDLYAPFIDRYADYLLRGEGYPIDIQLLSNKIANYVSKHIKYVVCPKGKSNSSGILIWTDTGAPFAAKNASYKFSYYSENFPISLGLSRSHYTYFKNPENNPDDRKINRLMVMNAIYDNYLKSGNLIMRTAAEEHLPAEFDRRIHKCDQGPGETTSTGYQMVFGPFNDYYRPVSIVWNTNLLTLTESR